MQRDWAELKIRQGHFNEAETLLKAALATWDRIGCRSIYVGEAFGYLAETYIYQGRHGEAEEALRQAALFIGDSVPAENIERAFVDGLQGWLCVRRGDLAEGEKLLERARGVAARHVPSRASLLVPPSPLPRGTSAQTEPLRRGRRGTPGGARDRADQTTARAPSSRRDTARACHPSRRARPGRGSRGASSARPGHEGEGRLRHSLTDFRRWRSTGYRSGTITKNG